ncbi:hypothetical protein DFH08DRAFT_704093, partial [Mycena albidolilacea]
LVGYRQSGLPMNPRIACATIIAVIKMQVPAPPNSFKVLEQFMQNFLCSVLNWSPRVGIRAAAHILANAEELCEHSFYRLVYAMKWFNIPPEVYFSTFIRCT